MLAYVNNTGCEDGSVVVWDLHTRQPVRALQKAGKGPVTGLLVMDRPAFLASGQGGRGERSNASAHGTSRKGPQRPQPLSPFNKYYGSVGALKPWEGVPTVIDGSTPYKYAGSCISNALAVSQCAAVCHQKSPVCLTCCSSAPVA